MTTLERRQAREAQAREAREAREAQAREAREAREAAKAERAWVHKKAEIRKIAKGAEVSFASGWVCLTFPSGQVFKCRGPAPDEVFGIASE